MNKNNNVMKRSEKQRFTIKKYSFGAASVLIGISIFLGGSSVAAEELVAAQAVQPESIVSLVEASPEEMEAVEQADSTSQAQPEAAQASQVAVTSDAQVSPSHQLASSEVASVTSSTVASEASKVAQSEVATQSVSTQPTAAPAIRRSIATTASQAAKAQEVTSVKETDKGFELQYNREMASGEQIQFAVWTERQGQDDLVWYKADASGAAFIDFAKHREYGKYNIHTYSSIVGRLIGRDAKSYTLAEPKVAAKFDKIGHNTYQVTISNVPSSITSISLPTWSDKNGQDDIKWYVATKGDNQTYTATINTPEFGHYSVHVYGKSSVTGGTIGLMATPGLTNADSREKAKVTVQGYAKDKTKLTVQVNGANAKTIKSVSIAAWSDKGGQDDLKWYSPAIVKNSASQVVDIKDLSNTSDTYHVHAYTYYADGTVDGQVLGDFAIQKTAEKNQVAVEMTAKGLAISLDSTNVSDYRNVRFAVWSDKNGQDDLKWYNADASGKATAPYQNHKDYGKYNIHTYLSTPKGMVGLTTTSYSVPAPSAKASVTKVEGNTYQVRVTDVPAYISSVQVPIWSERNGQDDIKWYQASRQTDGSYLVSFSPKGHQNNIGRYNIHVYGKHANGKMEGLVATNYTVTDIEVAQSARFQLGQRVEIQDFATNLSTGDSLKEKQGWLGTISKIAKNVYNATGGWEYEVLFDNAQVISHVLEQDLREVLAVNLQASHSREANTRILQEAMTYAQNHKGLTLLLPAGEFVIGSQVTEESLSPTNDGQYVVLASDTKLRGSDQGTNLIVDGTMLWFGLPTGPKGSDGLSNFTLEKLNIRAKDMINGDYFMIMLNHGNNISIRNNSFTMVQKLGRHILDLGGVQNITISGNRFIGYAPSLSQVTRIANRNLHDFYAEAIQIDASNNQGGWDANMVRRIAPVAYQSYNSSRSVLSNNVVITSNQFLPYKENGRVIAYSSTIGQHSSQVGNITIANNRMENTLTKRLNSSEWVMKPIHYVNAPNYRASVYNNTIV